MKIIFDSERSNQTLFGATYRLQTPDTLSEATYQTANSKTYLSTQQGQNGLIGSNRLNYQIEEIR